MSAIGPKQTWPVSSGHAASIRLHRPVPAVEGVPATVRPTLGSRNKTWPLWHTRTPPKGKPFLPLADTKRIVRRWSTMGSQKENWNANRSTKNTRGSRGEAANHFQHHEARQHQEPRRVPDVAFENARWGRGEVRYS